MAKTKKESHPLYNTWAWMKRMRDKNFISDSWYDDFYKFAEDMGEKPSSSHRLERINKDQGFSKDNCYWKETIPCTDRAEWMRNYRKKNPQKFKEYELKRRLGLPFEDYELMVNNQNNLCAICKQPEKFNGSLAVDHCHESGDVRGLLCTNCNRGLGHFKDSVEVLNNAIKYLEGTNQ